MSGLLNADIRHSLESGGLNTRRAEEVVKARRPMTATRKNEVGSTDAGSHGGRKWVVEVGRQDWNNERADKNFSRHFMI